MLISYYKSDFNRGSCAIFEVDKRYSRLETLIKKMCGRKESIK